MMNVNSIIKCLSFKSEINFVQILYVDLNSKGLLHKSHAHNPQAHKKVTAQYSGNKICSQ